MIRCIFENKNQAYLRHVCVNAIIIKNNQILLGKRGRCKGRKILESGKWGLIGGFLERDETLERGLKREVLEESGWEIDHLELLRINDNPNRPAEDRQNIDIIFMAKAVEKIKNSENEEVTHLKWFDLDKIPPKEKIAFDHGENIQFYLKWREEKFKLPIFGSLAKFG